MRLQCPKGPNYRNLGEKELINSTGHGMPLSRYCMKLTMVSKTLRQTLGY